MGEIMIPANQPADLEYHLLKQVDVQRDFFWHRLRWRAVRRSLTPTRSARFTVLDVGAGAGLSGEFLLQDFPQARYRFIEPLAGLRTHLAGRFGADADQLDHAEQGHDADFLLLLDVLEHQEDDVAFLESLRARMKPGAVLVITVPALQWLWTKWDERLGHYRRYTLGQLKQVSCAAGFKVLDGRYLFSEMLPLGIWRRVRGIKDGAEGTEFPRLPKWVNDAFVALGIVTQSLFGWLPFGTSALVALTANPEKPLHC